MPQPTVDVKNAAGSTVTINTINPNGQALKADSQPVVIASDQTVPVSIAAAVVINSSTPVSVTVPGSVVINDTTPVDVAVTGQVVINDTVPVDVAVAGPVVVDDTTPVDINVTNAAPIPVSLTEPVQVSNVGPTPYATKLVTITGASADLPTIYGAALAADIVAVEIYNEGPAVIRWQVGGAASGTTAGVPIGATRPIFGPKALLDTIQLYAVSPTFASIVLYKK